LTLAVDAPARFLGEVAVARQSSQDAPPGEGRLDAKRENRRASSAALHPGCYGGSHGSSPPYEAALMSGAALCLLALYVGMHAGHGWSWLFAVGLVGEIGLLALASVVRADAAAGSRPEPLRNWP
jgi:hypothetical protein